MERTIVGTERASADIEAIVRYIARRNPEASSRIGMGIYERVQILLTHPEAGTVLDEFRDDGWRKLIYHRWKIIYKIVEERVVIGRVWPAAKDEADLTTPLE